MKSAIDILKEHGIYYVEHDLKTNTRKEFVRGEFEDILLAIREISETTYKATLEKIKNDLCQGVFDSRDFSGDSPGMNGIINEIFKINH